MANKKNWIYIKRGLSQDPEHRERMGNRIWLFMHMIDRADWETGTVFDWRDKDEASDMSLAWRTLQHQRQELEELGYITCAQLKSGQNITIHNWISPRNYAGEVVNPPPVPKKAYTQPDEGTPEGTPEGTQHPYSGLGTPSISLINHKSKAIKTSAQKPRGGAELKELEDLFSELTRLSKPNCNTAKQRSAAAVRWWQPLKRIRDTANGRSADVIKLAVAAMRKGRLTISAPQSIEQVALALYAERFATATTPTQAAPKMTAAEWDALPTIGESQND